MYAQGQVNTVGGSAVGLAGSYIGAAVMAQETAVRQPEVRAEMERLEKAVETLHKTAEILSERLDSVRNQCGNSALKEQAASPEPVLCGYAHAIRTQRQKVENAQAILQLAMNELEI